MKNRIKNQIISELLVNRLAIGVDKDMDEYVSLAGDNMQERWQKIFIKIYEKYPYLLNIDGFKIEDFVFSIILDMFSNEDIKKFDCDQIIMLGQVYADTIITFCKGCNKILSINQEEIEDD